MKRRQVDPKAWTCDDLLDCWETVDASYRPDGTARESLP